MSEYVPPSHPFARYHSPVHQPPADASQERPLEIPGVFARTRHAIDRERFVAVCRAGTPPQEEPVRVRSALVRRRVGLDPPSSKRRPLEGPAVPVQRAAGAVEDDAGSGDDGGCGPPAHVAPGVDGGWDDVDANEAAEVHADSSGVVYMLTIFETGFHPCDVPALRNECAYITAQLERAPTTGRLHFQTLIVTKDKIKFRTLQRKLAAVFDPPPFIKPVRLSLCDYDRARAYCQKEETREQPHKEWGKWPFKKGHKAGTRTDIDGALAWAIANPDASDPQQWVDAGYGPAWLKYPRLRILQSAPLAARKLPPPTLYWFWGGPGTGKTKRATMLAEKLASKYTWRVYYRKNHMVDRWPNYTSQEIVVWEEFREVLPHQSLGAMCSLWDRGTPLPTEEKWGGSHMVARIHIVTCPLRPEEAFPHSAVNAHGQIGQLLRRITQCVEFKNVLPVAVDVVDLAADCFAEVMAEEPDV